MSDNPILPDEPGVIDISKVSGLYNILCGRNPLAPILFGLGGFTKEIAHLYPLGRYRDITISKDGRSILVFTRNGHGHDHITKALQKHPNYIGLEYASEDNSYITYQFRIDQWRTISKETCQDAGLPHDTRFNQWTVADKLARDTYDPYERMKRVLEDHTNNVDNEDQRRLARWHKKFAECFQWVIENQKPLKIITPNGAIMILALDGNYGFFDIDAKESLLARDKTFEQFELN